MVASYPFDDSAAHEEKGLYSKSEDDGLFRYLALVYSQNHPTMRIGKPNCTNVMEETFKDGITNGAAWYDVPGEKVPWASLMIGWMYCDVQDRQCFNWSVATDCVESSLFSRLHHGFLCLFLVLKLNLASFVPPVLLRGLAAADLSSSLVRLLRFLAAKFRLGCSS